MTKLQKLKDLGVIGCLNDTETPIKFTQSERNSSEIYEILVEDIPKGAYKIEFSNNW